ncbi:MAG TPA: hypothetical protein VJP41_05345 [Gaiellaceae bacterium]|nr:hypothetical protein [Gaiellaceae bacterium]
MFKRRFRLPSPALVISMVTLSIVLGGTAVAASTAKHGDTKADTKLVKKLAPSLSVKHAKTANSATTAANATHATSADSATNATNATNATHATSADSATNATTAANANALGGVGASGYVQNGGNIYVQLGFTNWVPWLSTDPLSATHYSDTTGYLRSSTGASWIEIDAPIPTSLYGKALAFVGFQFCYVTNGNSLTDVLVYQDTQTTQGFGGDSVVASDATTRTDSACRTYTPSSPIAMTSADQFSLWVDGNWATASSYIYFGRVTAILQPTSSAATAPKATARAARASTGRDPHASH